MLERKYINLKILLSSLSLSPMIKMKILAFILAIYILAITAIPCVDGLNGGNFCNTEISKNATDNHENHLDHCSPFCTCDCCASPVIYQSYVIQFNSFTLKYKHFSQYFSKYKSSVFLSIWQPPKLS